MWLKQRRLLCQKKINQTRSILTLLKTSKEKNQDKINVDRTYVEPQEFQSKEPKRQSSLFRFTVKQTSIQKI